MPGGVSQPLDLLLSAARSSIDSSEAERLKAAVAAITDWDAVLLAAAEHNVIPLMARALSACPAAPLPVRRELDKRYVMRLARGRAMAQELRLIIAELREAGIEALAYKGPALAAMAYGDPLLRHPSADLDLLLHRTDILRARDLLAARGYQSILSAEQERHFFRHRYHLHCERRNPETHVELHWALTPAYWPFAIDGKRLWGGAREVMVAGAEIPAPDAECTLLALCAHGAKEGWRKLSQIVDVAQLIRAHPGLDWDWVMAEARRMRRERVVFLGLELAAVLIGAKVPQEVVERTRRDSEVGALRALIHENLRIHYAPTGADFHSYALRVWHHPADRLNYLRYRMNLLPEKMRILAEPSAQDRELVDLDERLSFLYFFIRPVRALMQRDVRVVLRKAMKGL